MNSKTTVQHFKTIKNTSSLSLQNTNAPTLQNASFTELMHHFLVGCFLFLVGESTVVALCKTDKMTHFFPH